MCQQLIVVKYLVEKNEQDLQDIIAYPNCLHVVASHYAEDVAKDVAELVMQAGCKLDYQDEKVT